MVRVTLVSATGADVMDDYQTLDEALLDVRTHWCEDMGVNYCYLVSESEAVRASIMRPRGGDGELCITTWDDGQVTLHRCRYVLDQDGMYHHTDITAVDTTVLLNEDKDMLCEVRQAV